MICLTGLPRGTDDVGLGSSGLVWLFLAETPRSGLMAGRCWCDSQAAMMDSAPSDQRRRSDGARYPGQYGRLR